MPNAIRWRRTTIGTIRWKPSWRTTPIREFCTHSLQRATTTCASATYRARAARSTPIGLVLDAPHPDFTLRIAPDNPRLGVGDTAAITVAAVRHDDFSGEIKLAVENLPPGYAASQALIAAGQNEGRLTITSPAGAATGVLSPVITGMATIGKDTVLRKAESAESLMQAFAYTHVLPTKQLFLAVIPGTAYTPGNFARRGQGVGS